MGAFLRVINADENGRIAIDLLEKTLQLDVKADREINLQLVGAEIQDALEILEGVHLHFDDAVPLFIEADTLVEQAFSSGIKSERDTLMMQALDALNSARDAMIIRTAG